MSELDKLDKIADKKLYGAGVSKDAVLYGFEMLSRYAGEGSLIEFGPAEGHMTDLLVKRYPNMSIVEGSKGFCDDLKKKHPTIDVNHSLFETFETEQQFDNIVLGHVLEHVDCAVSVLEKVKRILKPKGKIFAAVPNSRSLHRQAAVLMGLLDFEEGMSPLDIEHGHKRVYNPETFRSEFVKANLNIDVFGGYWLKPLSNSQIEQGWTPEMLNAFMKLGERYPDIAGEIYIVASLKK